MFITKKITAIELVNEIQKIEYLKESTFRLISGNAKIKELQVYNNAKGKQKIDKTDSKNKMMQVSGFYNISYDETTNLGDILFYPELDNFENIKEMRIADYIHKKLELYNFEWDMQTT